MSNTNQLVYCTARSLLPVVPGPPALVRANAYSVAEFKEVKETKESCPSGDAMLDTADAAIPLLASIQRASAKDSLEALEKRVAMLERYVQHLLDGEEDDPENSEEEEEELEV